MKFNKKILFITMLVMLVCCVSAVSATDINGTDDASDAVVIDEVTDVVEDVEIDEVSEDPVEENTADASDSVAGENLRSGTIVTNETYSQYFDENGYLTNDTSIYKLTFQGNFNEVNTTFGNFKINRFVTLDVTDAVFTNIGFDLKYPSLNLVGTNFIVNENATNTAPIRVLADSVVIDHVNITINAPEGRDYYGIDVQNALAVRLLNNIITYNCSYLNNESYNYAIKAKNSPSLNIISNTITANVPLKKPNWDYWMSIDADYIAGIAIEKCNYSQILNNDLTVIADLRDENATTLDAFIIADSAYVHVENNIIKENDEVTPTGNYSYIYGMDVYSCTGIFINNNTIIMNGNESGGHNASGNGTGAAYCIQLSGNHSGVVVSNNILTTQNNGPNLGIYSQNYHAQSFLNITGNTIKVTGKAGSDSWSLVSGIEVQDSIAEIYDNVITVNNTAGYNETYYAFGISYAQWTNHTHQYDIQDNHVTLINGDYAVYLLNSTDVYCRVMYNTLTTTHYHGDDAVFCNPVHADVRRNN